MLDERRFEEWRDLFADDGYYWVPARPDQPNPLDEVSIFYDDKDLMENAHSAAAPSRAFTRRSRIPERRTW